jgi:DNA (cytosine-5)-methyltransferase 1
MVTHIDCFSGVGGIATGFHAAGIATSLAIEKVESCADTYRANHPNVCVINDDIRKVGNDTIKRLAGNVDIVTSGMPCETFSTAGSSSRSFYDARQTLFEESVRIADAANAKFVLFENVPGFANKRLDKAESKLVIDALYDSLNAHNYCNMMTVILNAKDYGVPQSRQRIFVLATKDANIKLRPPISTLPPTTVADAFADLPLVDTNMRPGFQNYLRSNNHYSHLMADRDFWKIAGDYRTCTYHNSPKHRPGTVERFKMIRTGEGLKSLFDRLGPDQVKLYQEQKILPKKWYIQRNRRLSVADVSPTVTSHCIDELLHPVSNRAITIREAARLQSFPNCYDFIGGPEICPHISETQDKYEQIGDAVPPLLAYHWAILLKELLDEYSDKSERSLD